LLLNSIDSCKFEAVARMHHTVRTIGTAYLEIKHWRVEGVAIGQRWRFYNVWSLHVYPEYLLRHGCKDETRRIDKKRVSYRENKLLLPRHHRRMKLLVGSGGPIGTLPVPIFSQIGSENPPYSVRRQVRDYRGET